MPTSELVESSTIEIEYKSPDLLAIPDSVFPKKGLIRDLIEHYDPICEVLKDYLLAAGIMLISSVVQDRFVLTEGSSTTKLNLYTVLIGKSTATRKTTALYLCLDILVDHFEDRYQGRFLFPTKISLEAWRSLMAGTFVDGKGNELQPQRRGLLPCSEYSDLLSHMKKK